MSRLLLALVLTAGAATVAEAQALQEASAVDSVAPMPVPSLATDVEASIDLAPVSPVVVEQREPAANTSAARELSARTLFALIGVVVVVVALVSLAS